MDYGYSWASYAYFSWTNIYDRLSVCSLFLFTDDIVTHSSVKEAAVEDLNSIYLTSPIPTDNLPPPPAPCNASISNTADGLYSEVVSPELKFGDSDCSTPFSDYANVSCEALNDPCYDSACSAVTPSVDNDVPPSPDKPTLSNTGNIDSYSVIADEKTNPGVGEALYDNFTDPKSERALEQFKGEFDSANCDCNTD